MRCKKCKCKACSCIVNEQVKISVNKIIQNPDEKGIINVKVPTKTSELINDSGFGQGGEGDSKIENELESTKTKVDEFIRDFSVTTDTEFNAESNNPIANSTVTPLANSLDFFINEDRFAWSKLNYNNTNEVLGSFINTRLNGVPLLTGRYSDNCILELKKFKKIRVIGDLKVLGSGNTPLFLAKKVNGSWINLITKESTITEFDIDKNAEAYIYSRVDGFVDIEVYGINYNSVKKYIDENINTKDKNEFIFYPEDFGAKPINPKTPDDSIDSTTAFNNMFNYMFNKHPNINSYRVIMSGVYKIGGSPIHFERSQLNIPFSANLDWNFKSVYFEGLTRPSLTDRGDNLMMNPLLGSGFYCSYINSEDKYRSVIGFSGGNNFGLRVGQIYMDNISCYIKTHNESNESIVNNMGAFDFSNLATFGFSDLYITTTSAGLNTMKPNMYSVGLYTPKYNNMASVYGNSLKVMGFGIGAILTEHMNLNHLIAVFNREGVNIENTYPINIGNATLEHNNIHVKMYPNSAVNFNVFQTEDINDVKYWFNRTENMIKGDSTSRVTINQIMCHVWGGNKIPFTYDTSLKIRYLMDESGNSKLN